LAATKSALGSLPWEEIENIVFETGMGKAVQKDSVAGCLYDNEITLEIAGLDSLTDFTAKSGRFYSLWVEDQNDSCFLVAPVFGLKCLVESASISGQATTRPGLGISFSGKSLEGFIPLM
jgi:hypothetical protein